MKITIIENPNKLPNCYAYREFLGKTLAEAEEAFRAKYPDYHPKEAFFLQNLSRRVLYVPFSVVVMV
jgi:hypothetical protein